MDLDTTRYRIVTTKGVREECKVYVLTYLGGVDECSLCQYDYCNKKDFYGNNRCITAYLTGVLR